MAREDLHFRLRIPEDLKVRIENAANINERSMTAEIIARLQWTFGPSDAEFAELRGKITDQDVHIRELERARDEVTYKFELLQREHQLLQREHQSRREQHRDEMIKVEELRAALAEESGRSNAFRSVIEMLASRIKEWSDDPEFSIDKIIDAVEKTQRLGKK
ncbi:Arc family DNA-binding protein [Sinorhizobium meliloti]|uniref:Arc family DNA-binding protein n=1 Tax=Rhizobium meliloti TaxID=382 RepID=UPI0003708E72|nr:Arc family DNA-binding protein [Sinorhizobium meliloti]MDE3873269.1 Arc family DNA-binding protein [Sinorhizobium meliloti]MQX23359.1 Arc family DNA-binding protein [Sinorhizobium meliloti]UFX08688.1 Arc family DNA-binding protein [Sinorhizobium meliloti]